MIEGYPLYNSKAHDQFLADAKDPNANFGLEFNRFVPLFLEEANDKSAFLKRLNGNTGDVKQIRRIWERQFNLIRSQQGQWFTAKSDWHFVSGMGNAHRLENGITFHHTLGLPYLPGSSVKGMVRAFCELECEFDAIKMLRLFGSDNKDTTNQNHDSIAGGVIFFDALPVKRIMMMTDIITPHTGNWLSEGEKGNVAPADYHTPNPIKFLVAKEVEFMFSLARASHVDPAKNNKYSVSDEELQELRQACIDALAWYGAGAKTSVGYGTFSETQNEDILSFARRTEENQRKAEAEKRAASKKDAIKQVVKSTTPASVKTAEIVPLTQGEFDALYSQIEEIIANKAGDKTYRVGIVNLLDNETIARLTSGHCTLLLQSLDEKEFVNKGNKHNNASKKRKAILNALEKKKNGE